MSKFLNIEMAPAGPNQTDEDKCMNIHEASGSHNTTRQVFIYEKYNGIPDTLIINLVVYVVSS